MSRGVRVLSKRYQATITRTSVALIVALCLVLVIAVPADASWFFERWYQPAPEPSPEPAPEPDPDPTPEPDSDPPSEPTPIYGGGYARRWLTPPAEPAPPPDEDTQPPVDDPPAQDPVDDSQAAYYSSHYPQSRVRASDETELLRMVNEERESVGLKPLTLDQDLVHLARAKAWDIIDNNYFAHQSPTYGSVWDMMRRANIPFVYAGENLARAGNVWVVHYRLMNSSGHRQNILRDRYTHVGIAVLRAEPSGVMAVQVFVGR